MSELPCTPSFKLSGKTALVVGATSGIGLGAAVALAEAGALVTIAARNSKDLEALAEQMAAGGWKVNAQQMDITDIEATAKIIKHETPFDVLVNSAGTAFHSEAVETAPSDFDAAMNVNLRGAYFLTQVVAKRLLEVRKPGSLINISSQMGHVGGVERAVYCASKHAIEGFTKAMAIEFGPHNIRINTICPTFIQTPLTKATFDDPQKREWILGKIKLRRAGKVEDIMGAVQYLASDASAMVTGTALMIDGGWTAD